MRTRSALLAVAAVLALATPVDAATPVLTVTGSAGRAATVQVPPGRSVRLGDIDAGARYQGPPTGVFIRRSDRRSARPGDPQTYFLFFADPPTERVQPYEVLGDQGPGAPATEDQRLPAGTYDVLLLGTTTVTVRLPGATATATTVRATRRFHQRFSAGAVPGRPSTTGWQARAADPFDLRSGTVVATTAVHTSSLDVGEFHQCVAAPGADRCRSTGRRVTARGGEHRSRVLRPGADPVSGQILTTYDGLREPEQLWRSLLVFDARG